MDYILSAIYNIPVVKNFLIQEENQVCFVSQEGRECIAPLFQTVQETPQPIPTTITGRVPKWIDGSLLRNGPGKFEIGKYNFNHWFDGMALMHKFTIAKGEVTYMSKFLQSNAYKSNEAENRLVVSEFGTLATPDPCKSLFQRFMSYFEMPQSTDNASVQFVKYKKDYCVSTETNIIHKVDPATLETEEKVDWSKYIAVNGATAHPHYDPCGTAYNMGNSYGKNGILYNIIKVPVQESEHEDTLKGAQVICSIPAVDQWNPSYYHSFGMTENYVVFIEQPLKMNLLKILTGKLRGIPLSDCLFWDPSWDTAFHVVNKHSGEVHSVTYHSQAVAMFHQINAYEDQGCIVLDLCCQDDGNVVHLYNLQNLRKSGIALEEAYNKIARSLPRRFVFPLNINSDTPQEINLIPLDYTTATAVKQANGKVWCTPENLYEDTFAETQGIDFPTINYAKCNAKKYCYFYGCGFQHFVGTSLIKMDVVTKEIKIWQEDGLYPSEPVFVPSPGSQEEDDGVILSVTVSPRQDKMTSLLILDAKTFTEIARAEVPVHMPYGFHGVFLPQI
ncbi:carotenoid-cleaving dioxygenase, mitochondrial-like [Hyperolius riggenbachi]|uniref:carotenoid-cleaving dioxygenase, mitochondrial-like n=1 Tax=Hyperolius riggenbachi TaxID=752182 RepID=UPI0035A2644B